MTGVSPSLDYCQSSLTPICDNCTHLASLGTIEPFKRFIKECPLCNLILEQLSGRSPNLSVNREGSTIILNSTTSSIHSPILRLYPLNNTNPRSEPDHSSISPDIYIFAQLRAWLQNCDQTHSCHGRGKRSLPTRLLNVNPSSNPDDLRLDHRAKIKGDKFIALSHCWGQLDEDKSPLWRTKRGHLRPHIRDLRYGDIRNKLREAFEVIREVGLQNLRHTFQGELADRSVGFKLSELPQTFMDAIEVVRQLGIQYLWIDSLCIIQDSDHDWEKESKRMEDIFASAYCTIAATVAPNSRSGFLGGREMNKGLYVRNNSGDSVYITTNLADFDKDVNDTSQAPLNTRAWVMQERLLSSRTIHFSKNQVYGECGEGVYAGDKIWLQSLPGSKKYFQLDPQFPDRLRQTGFGRTIDFIEALIEDYSCRKLTKPSDRPVAVAGLMDRIAKALPCRIHYGIVGSYLQRTLLWQRSDKQVIERIKYDRSVPSWSWMAYEGAVRFIHAKYKWGNLDLFTNQIEFDEKALTVSIWKFKDLRITIETGNGDEDAQLFDTNKSKKGWISFDREVDVSAIPKMVIVAKLGDHATGLRYFALFVKLVSPDANEYERLGVGRIAGDCDMELVGEGCRIC